MYGKVKSDNFAICFQNISKTAYWGKNQAKTSLYHTENDQALNLTGKK